MVVRRLVPGPIRRRYAVKFGIALLILGLSVGAIGFVATAAITDEVEDRVQEDQESFADSEAENLGQWLRQHRNTVDLIAKSDIIGTGNPDAIESELEDWEGASNAFAISYVEEDGDVLASSNEEFKSLPSEEITGNATGPYDDASSNTVGVSDPFRYETEGEEEILISFVGYIGPDTDRVVVYTANLQDYADLIGGDDETAVLVLNENDEVVASNAGLGADNEHFGTAYHDEGLLREANRGPTTTDNVDGILEDVYGFGDGEYVVTGSERSGWTVVVHESTDNAYGFVQSINEYGLYATGGGVLLIGLIGAVIGRNTAVSIDRLTAKARRMEEGELDVDLETKRIDNIGRLYDGFDSMRTALREQIEEAESARQEAERERERVQRINERLERKADEYSEIMETAADGDLTVRMDADTESEAMAEIGRDFNEMLAEIEETVAELDRFASEVATASEEVTASSEEVRSASEQVTESVQEISEGASRQNDSLQSVNQEMNGLSTTTEQIAASSNQVADVAERTVQTGQEGQEAAESAVGAMDEIEEESDRAVKEMRQLEDEVQQIDELITTISDIAQQTNMLALNANIEASRSAGNGGGGEGFSVVAKQVKELSEDVERTAKAAEERLEAIRQQTIESAAEVEQTSDLVEQASDEVQQAVDALEEIAEFARETNNGVQEISAATEQQAATTQEVVAMVDDAATISEETTAEAQHVAAAAEEQTTAMTEVSESASDLSKKASDLSAALDRFELDVDEADAVPGDEPAPVPEPIDVGPVPESDLETVDAETPVAGEDGTETSVAGEDGAETSVAGEDGAEATDSGANDPLAEGSIEGNADPSVAAAETDAGSEEHPNPFADLESDDPLAFGGTETDGSPDSTPDTDGSVEPETQPEDESETRLEDEPETRSEEEPETRPESEDTQSDDEDEVFSFRDLDDE